MHIDKMINEILKGNHGKQIFEVTKIGTNVISDIEFKINNDDIDSISSKYFGKKMLITDQYSWETEEILEAYRDQSGIENIFKDTKNNHHFSICPQYHWTDSKVRVHTFCCLLGLMLTSVLKKELFDAGIKIENEKLINELSGIREVYILRPDKNVASGFSADKKIEEMTQIQADIWKSLERSILNKKKS